MASDQDKARVERLYRFATALKRDGKLVEALAAYDSVLAAMPDLAEAHNNRGNILDELGRPAEAISGFERALALRPDYVEAHNNMGVALMHLRRLDEALAAYDRAVGLDPAYAPAESNRGNVLKELGRLDEALAAYDRALSLNPASADAQFNKSLVLLLSGRWDEGWPLFEARWRQQGHPERRRTFVQPLWLGKEPLVGKKILLHGEQGLGDAIQFARFAPLVAAQGARVILQVAPALVELMTSLEGVAEVIPTDASLPPFDVHCPLMSLPLAFGTTPANVPSRAAYLAADPAKASAWAGRLGPKTKPRIGLVWSSLSTFGDDAKRSLALKDFLAAFPMAGQFDLVSLQKEVKPSDREDLARRSDIRFFGPDLADFAETAALTEAVDLVVATCTSVPHLSGALGKKTCLLLSYVPDWRWMMSGTETPWYASLELYRQASLGDWAGVLKKLETDLASGRLLS